MPRTFFLGKTHLYINQRKKESPMGTRAKLITQDTQTDRFVSTYVHFDGYPNHTGATLFNFYNTSKKAIQIANAGYISFLHNTFKETMDASQNSQQPANFTTLAAALKDAFDDYAYYVYFWDQDRDEWFVYSADRPNSEQRLSDLV